MLSSCIWRIPIKGNIPVHEGGGCLSSGPVKVGFDSSAIIGFDEPNVNMLLPILDYFKDSGHVMIVCDEVWRECYGIRNSLTESAQCRRVQTMSATFQEVKSTCRSARISIQDNDYCCVASAIDEGCEYLVSNDAGMITAASHYSRQKGIAIQAFTPANFLYYMYSARRDLFPWKMNIKKVTKLYHHVEIENIFDGIRNRRWELVQARSRFQPYATNIYQTIDGIP